MVQEASSPSRPSHWNGSFPGPSCRLRGVSSSSRLPSDGTAAELETRSGWLGKQSRGVLTDSVSPYLAIPIWDEVYRHRSGSLRVSPIPWRWPAAMRVLRWLPWAQVRCVPTTWRLGWPARLLGAIIHCDDDSWWAAGGCRSAPRGQSGWADVAPRFLPAADGAKDPADAAASFPPLANPFHRNGGITR